jgi:hypothetical protein
MGDKSTVDPTKPYTEACNTLRHYSTASLSVRAASVVQGIVLLSAWAVAFTAESSVIEVLLPLIGLLFTVLLYRFHMGYFRASEVFSNMAARMEEKFFEEGCRPFGAYDQQHDRLYHSRKGKWLTLDAPFTFVGTMFGLALLVSVLHVAMPFRQC